MANLKFTETRLDRLKHDPSKPKIQRIWDSEVQGLGMEAFPSGAKSWIFRYRVHGKQRIITMGRRNEISLIDAQDIALHYRSIIRKGGDPKLHRDAPVEGLTLDKMFKQYIGTKYYKSKSKSFHDNLESTYRKYLKAELGHYPLVSITRQQISKMVDDLIEAGKEGAARGLLNRVRILFNYALQKGMVEHSAADHITPSYTTSGTRTKWLETEDELREAWWFKGPPQVRALIRWALLTGCRRDEARRTEYSCIDDEVWTVKGTKNTRDLILPVMPEMEEIVTDMRSTFRTCKYLFPATTTTSKAIPAGSLDYLIRQRTGATWSMHTLRHTVESHMRELEILEEHRDLVLNHVRKGSGDRYGHGTAVKLKRKAMAKWHEYLMKVVNG